MGTTLLRDITYGEFCGPKKEGETQIVRNPSTAKGELRQLMHLGINTMWATFEYNLKVGTIYNKSHTKTGINNRESTFSLDIALS